VTDRRSIEGRREEGCDRNIPMLHVLAGSRRRSIAMRGKLVVAAVAALALTLSAVSGADARARKKTSLPRQHTVDAIARRRPVARRPHHRTGADLLERDLRVRREGRAGRAVLPLVNSFQSHFAFGTSLAA
jgi:hypothetical protein